MSNQLKKVEGEKFLWKRTIKGVITYYLRKRKETEEDAVETLCSFFKAKHVDELDADLPDDDHEWRKRNVSKGHGDRTCDLELNTLSKALDWAVRKKTLTANPISSRTCYYTPSEARHAKEVAEFWQSHELLSHNFHPSLWS